MVTPLSQFVGVQAFLNVTTGARYSQIPDEVVKYVLGQYGPPPGELDPDVAATVLASPRAEQFRREEHRLDLGEARARYGDAISDELLLLRMMLPAEQVDAMLARPRTRARGAGAAPRRHARRGPHAAPAARDRSHGARGARARPMSLLARHRRGRLRRGRDAAARERPERACAARIRSPGAIETVERVRASGRRVLFFTNGTGRAAGAVRGGHPLARVRRSPTRSS